MEVVWQIHAKAGGAMLLRRGHRHLLLRRSVLGLQCQRLQGEEYCVAPFR